MMRCAAPFVQPHAGGANDILCVDPPAGYSDGAARALRSGAGSPEEAELDEAELKELVTALHHPARGRRNRR